MFALRAFFLLLRVCLARIYKCDCVQAQAQLTLQTRSQHSRDLEPWPP